MTFSEWINWICLKMMRVGRGSALLRPLTEIQMQKKLQVRPRILLTQSLLLFSLWDRNARKPVIQTMNCPYYSISLHSSLPFWLGWGKKALTCRSQRYDLALQVARKSWQSEGSLSWNLWLCELNLLTLQKILLFLSFNSSPHTSILKPAVCMRVATNPFLFVLICISQLLMKDWSRMTYTILYDQYSFTFFST